MKYLCSHLAMALLAVAAVYQPVLAQDPSSQSATTYTYQPINYTDASPTFAYGISNSGEVVGFYENGGCTQEKGCGFTLIKTYASVECALENGTQFFDISLNKNEIVGTYSYYGGVHGFIWQGNSSCFDIVEPNGQTSTEATGVNDSGNVVGYYTDSSGDYQGFLYNATSQEYSTISCTSWANTRALAINDAGVIVGDVFTGDASNPGAPSAFVYESGKCTVFKFPKSYSSSARGINSSDQISGNYTDTSTGPNYGFVKTGSTFQSLNFPKSTGTIGVHINNKGQVAGIYADSAMVNHGFVATPK